jgi:uncharacterized delta-60 repeat protein
MQADGKILVGGWFTNLAGQVRNHIARLNADGSLDSDFNPNADGYVYSLAVQADGKILVGGAFTNLAGQTRNCIARLNADGSLDPDFNPSADGLVYSLAVQADGKVLAGGAFSKMAGLARNRIARINGDGSVDPNFDLYIILNSYVQSLAVQADGKILVGGSFMILEGQRRNCIARLNIDGSVDPDFNPNAGNIVDSLAVQADGKILVGGRFFTMGGQPRNRIARLENDAATQILTVPHHRRVEWLRGGTAPEAQSVSFDLSTDGGTNWSPLGVGTRIPGGWELTGLTLPGGLVRARARVVGGMYNGSSGLVEAVATAPVAPSLVNPSLAPHQFRFLLPTVSGKVYQVQFAPALGNALLWETVRTVNGDGSTIEVLLTPSNSAGFYRVILAP